ncbi:hypothetical protein Bbelb_406100 [Branchiostoma belcheri]|nr:hypothetical protein Bbelb_406100 [Branchiostoma belcheri]
MKLQQSGAKPREGRNINNSISSSLEFCLTHHIALRQLCSTQRICPGVSGSLLQEAGTQKVPCLTSHLHCARNPSPNFVSASRRPAPAKVAANANNNNHTALKRAKEK